MDLMSYCNLWNGTFNTVFHSANIVMATGFVIPQTFEQSFLCMRLLISVGLILTLWWASEIVVCKAPSLIIWNFAFLLINSCYVCALIKKHFPTFLSAEMLEFYELIFKPLQISKTDFQNFVKYGKTETYSFGRHFSQEHRTNVDKKLYILLSGMMTVRCDGFFLQAIQPMELINSVEWRCNQYGQTFTTYQVTVEAVSECLVLVFDENSLDKAFDLNPQMRNVIDALVGRDVARKLYSVNDVANMSSSASAAQQNSSLSPIGKGNSTMRRGAGLDFRRTVSVDAIHTGGKGHLRSLQWIRDANLTEINADERVLLVNYELDIPPGLEYLPHGVPVQVVDKDIMAEAQFLAQQRKYWPSGLL